MEQTPSTRTPGTEIQVFCQRDSITYAYLAALIVFVSTGIAFRLFIPENESIRDVGLYFVEKNPPDWLHIPQAALIVGFIICLGSVLGIVPLALKYRRASFAGEVPASIASVFFTRAAMALASCCILFLILPYWSHGIFEPYGSRVRDFSSQQLIQPGWIRGIWSTIAFFIALMGPILALGFAAGAILRLMRKPKKPQLIAVLFSLASAGVVIWCSATAIKLQLWIMD